MARPDSRSQDLEGRASWVGPSPAGQPAVRLLGGVSRKSERIALTAVEQTLVEGGREATPPAPLSSSPAPLLLQGPPGFPGKAGAPGPPGPQAEKVSRTPRWPWPQI